MFVSVNQFYFFIQSVFIGVVTAFLYEPISFLKTFIKNVIIANGIDVLFAVVPFLLYLNLSLAFSFPCFRLYMFLGVVLGFFIENKSFHKMLAKVYFVVYNKTISFIRRKNRDGRKEAKVNIGRDCVCGNHIVRFNRRLGVFTYHRRRKKKDGRKSRLRKS